MHGTELPSDWVRRWTHLVQPHGQVLDLACGRGRHTHWFAGHQHRVTAVDVSSAALDAIDLPAARCEKIVADLENGPWPMPHRQFDAVVVTNYLWRALMPKLIDSLAPGGVLIYETFTEGNGTVGKPSRPDFLLRSGELLTSFGALRVVAFEDGFESRPTLDCSRSSQRFVQRIVVANPAPGIEPVRYALISTPPENALPPDPSNVAAG
ncbi:MAG: class I SAM-dependent methyltransferase [Polaromonas sp.]|nr:class I SAM-dependent methyltransferase [Polaromonas sp.]